jgi:L-asparaginase
VEYTAAALAFLVQQPGKPIVFTGSPFAVRGAGKALSIAPRFSEYTGLGITANLLNALHVAVSDVRGVLFMFGNRLLSGVHIVKSADEAVNPFNAFHGKVIGGVDFGLRLSADRARRSSSKPSFTFGMDPRVQAVALHPSMAFAMTDAIPQGTRGVVLQGGGKGVLDPSGLAPFAEALAGKLVVLHTERPLAKRDVPKGILPVSAMTYPVTFVKLMWALGQKDDEKAVVKLLQKNVAGEVIGKGGRL